MKYLKINDLVTKLENLLVKARENGAKIFALDWYLQLDDISDNKRIDYIHKTTRAISWIALNANTNIQETDSKDYANICQK